MTIFSVLTPLGALAGMAVRQKFSGSAGAGVCTALGAGTFLNVAAMEVSKLHNTKVVLEISAPYPATFFCEPGIIVYPQLSTPRKKKIK